MILRRRIPSGSNKAEGEEAAEEEEEGEGLRGVLLLLLRSADLILLPLILLPPK